MTSQRELGRARRSEPDDVAMFVGEWLVLPVPRILVHEQERKKPGVLLGRIEANAYQVTASNEVFDLAHATMALKGILGGTVTEHGLH